MPAKSGFSTVRTKRSRAPRYVPSVASTLPSAPPNLFVGTSGWAYPSWKPGFYPPEVPSRAFLNVYAERLTSVEVNYTFRKLPTATQLQGWIDATPPGFRFSFKAPQQITHFSRLRNVHAAIEEFVDSLRPARSAGRLGPLLFQLPPNFLADTTRLGDLLAAPALLPHSGTDALQVAFEFRHLSWFAEEVYSLLRAHNAALCVAEGDSLQTPEIHTASFRCYRLRRGGGYTPRQISAMTKRLVPLAAEGELYAYFKHEEEPTGALNAVDFLRCANRRPSRLPGRSAGTAPVAQ